MIDAVVGHGSFAVEMARALGLDPAQTHCITLRIHPDEAVMVTVEQYVRPYQLEAAVGAAKRFHLVAHEVPTDQETR